MKENGGQESPTETKENHTESEDTPTSPSQQHKLLKKSHSLTPLIYEEGRTRTKNLSKSPSPFLLSQNKHLALADQENSTHWYINKSQVAGTLSHNEKEISESTVSSDDGFIHLQTTNR